MKTLYVLALALFTGVSASAQNLEFLDFTSGTSISGTTVTIAGSCTDSDIVFKAILKNNSTTSDIDVKIKRYEVNVQSNTTHYFCWFACYAPLASNTEPVWPVMGMGPFNHKRTVTNGTADSSFFAHYQPNNVCGSATYRYVAFDGDNVNDSAWVEVVYDAPLGINDQPEIEAKEYPNPTESILNIVLSKVPSNGVLLVQNMVGKTVKQLSVRNNQLTVDVADLPNGIYFYSIADSRGILVTKKFVVKK